MKQGYSQANDVLHPIRRFAIGKRWLNLYENMSLSYISARYTLYWEGENNPVQHRMTWYEVLTVISDILSDMFECDHCHELHERLPENVADYEPKCCDKAKEEFQAQNRRGTFTKKLDGER